MVIILLQFVVSGGRGIEPGLPGGVFDAGSGSGMAGQAAPGHRVKTHAEDDEDQHERRDAADKTAPRSGGADPPRDAAPSRPRVRPGRRPRRPPARPRTVKAPNRRAAGPRGSRSRPPTACRRCPETQRRRRTSPRTVARPHEPASRPGRRRGRYLMMRDTRRSRLSRPEAWACSCARTTWSSSGDRDSRSPRETRMTGRQMPTVQAKTARSATS